MIARILIWNLFDSKTTLEELREHLPSLPDGDVWIANGAQDRFGLVSFSDELPDLGRVRELIGTEPQVLVSFSDELPNLGRVRELIGTEPQVAEEFDILS